MKRAHGGHAPAGDCGAEGAALGVAPMRPGLLTEHERAQLTPLGLPLSHDSVHGRSTAAVIMPYPCRHPSSLILFADRSFPTSLRTVAATAPRTCLRPCAAPPRWTGGPRRASPWWWRTRPHTAQSATTTHGTATPRGRRSPRLV